MAEKRRGRQLQVGSNVPVSIPDFPSGGEPDPIRNPNRYISIDGALVRSNGVEWSAVGVGDAAQEPTLALDFSTGDVTLTEEEFADNFRFTSDADLTTARNLTVGTPSPQYFAVANPAGSGANDLTVVIGTSNEPVASGVQSVFYADGSANGLVLLSSTSFSFDDATDTPANKTGSGGKRVVVDDPEGSLIYADDATLALNVTAGNATVTAVQFITNFRYVPTADLTTARTFTFPSGRPRVFQVQNPAGSGANNLTVTVGSTSIAVASGKERLFYTDGTTNGLVQLTDDSGGGFSGVRVSRSNNLSIPTGATTDMVWNVEDFDNGGWVDVGADGSFIRVPSGPTRARVTGKIRFTTNVTGVRRVQLWQGTKASSEPDIVRVDRDAASASTGGDDIQVDSGEVDLANGRDFGLKLFQDSGVALNVLGTNSSFMSGIALD